MASTAAASTTTTPAGSATPTTAAQLKTDIDHQLATTAGGTQVGNNVVSYDNGNVQIVFPEPGSAVASSYNPDARHAKGGVKARLADYQGCPTGVSTYWSCFYQNKNFGGTRAQFKDCGYLQSFNSYGFADETSSWVNTKPMAYVDTQRYNHAPLWHEKEARNSSNGHYSYSTYVGNADNDSAWYLKITVDGAGGSCNS
ncbi:MAG: hypothetical protein ACRDMJ_02170 [Solirubrobacteraceae bacterium]